MSRIGRLPVAIPEGVTVEIAENNKVTVTGPKGTLVRELPVEMEIEKRRQYNRGYKTERLKENEIFTWSYKNTDQQYGNRCNRRIPESS